MAHTRVAVLRWGITSVAALFASWNIAHALSTLHAMDTAEGRRVAVCIASRDLQLGETLHSDACRIAMMRTRAIAGDVVRNPSALNGRAVRVPVVAQTLITDRNLADRDRTGLDGVAPPGMRIVQISVEGGFQPHPGTRIDVLAAFGADRAKPSAAVVVRNALTVRADPSDRGKPAATIQLIVRPDQAQRLALAQATGTLSVAIAPPDEAGHPPSG